MRNLLKHWTDLLLGWLGVTSDTGGWDRWIAFLLVLLFVVLFDFACRLVIVRGVRRLVARTRAVWDDTLFSVRVLRCACHILSAVLLAVVLPIVFEERSGARVVPGDEKEDPLDFALWKSAKPGEPYWESPWGKGRPGWHIECSAMSEKYIPLPLDIHGGGLDLIFPHHENEIAQTEAALGKPLANIWMHNGFVQVDSEKMSKSLGNFKTIRDILESYLAETLRYFLAGKHYRSPIDFSLDNMDESERSQKRVYECLREVDKALARENWKPGAAPAELVEELKQQDQSFMDALEDDVNTAAAMGHLFNMVRIAGRVLEDKKLRNSEGGRDILKAFRDATAKWDTLLGLFAQKPEGFLASLREIRARRRGLDMNKVAGLLRERQEARAAKDFARSDAARDELAALGVEVRDTPEGPVWDII